MPFRPWPPPSPSGVLDPLGASAVEVEMAMLKRAKDEAWAARGVVPVQRDMALRYAEEWSRAKSADILRILDGLLPSTTLRAVEGPLTRKLLEQGLNDAAEKWLASIGAPPRAP